MPSTTHPFADTAPGYVPLADSPLTKVLAQIRFAHPASFAADQDRVANEVVKLLAPDYPVFFSGQDMQIEISPDGVTAQPSTTRLWRLSTADTAWRVTFGVNFVAIETTEYGRRREFAERLRQAWEAFGTVVGAPAVERLGVRYINQITSKERLSRLSELIRSEVLGLSHLRLAKSELLSALSEAQYRFENQAGLTARWGLLPAGQSLGLDLNEYGYPTWVLDTDSFREWAPGKGVGFDMYEEVRTLALFGYQFFRWTMTPEAMQEFGAQA